MVNDFGWPRSRSVAGASMTTNAMPRFTNPVPVAAKAATDQVAAYPAATKESFIRLA